MTPVSPKRRRAALTGKARARRGLIGDGTRIPQSEGRLG